MKYKYKIFILVAIVSCTAVEHKYLKASTLKSISLIEQNNLSENIIEKTESRINSNDLEITEEEINAESSKKLSLKFEKINSTDYSSYKKKYSNGIETDSTIVNKAGNSFTLTLNNNEKEFSCDIDYSDCTYYKGYLKTLNKYVLTYCGKGYCGTYLLDKNTGIQNYLESPFDSECECPSLSKDQNKLISYSTSVFDKESFIALYEKNIETQKIDFKQFVSFHTSDWRINEIIWIDANSIALSVYDKYGGKTGSELINQRYLKAEIE